MNEPDKSIGHLYEEVVRLNYEMELLKALILTRDQYKRFHVVLGVYRQGEFGEQRPKPA